jgi:hypothetical protein
LRAIAVSDQVSAVSSLSNIDPQLVVIDTVSSLFSAEYTGPARHLAIMEHLHDLATFAITTRCAVLLTNMVRNVPTTLIDQGGRNVAQAIIPTQQREFLGSSVAIYSHVRLKLEIADASRSIIRAKLMQPPRADFAEIVISHGGISDIQ